LTAASGPRLGPLPTRRRPAVHEQIGPTLLGNPAAVGEPVPGRSLQLREHPTVFGGGVWPPHAAVPGWTSRPVRLPVRLIMQQAVADEAPTEGIGTMADAPRVFLSYTPGHLGLECVPSVAEVHGLAVESRQLLGAVQAGAIEACEPTPPARSVKRDQRAGVDTRAVGDRAVGWGRVESAEICGHRGGGEGDEAAPAAVQGVAAGGRDPGKRRPASSPSSKVMSHAQDCLRQLQP
jgi:hypothetical protein